MHKDNNLFVIAGPNGAGKSTNSAYLVPINIPVFDFDKTRMLFYEADSIDHELRHTIAYNKTEELFTKKITQALRAKKSFAYETNFFTDNCMYWPNLFKKEGYKIHLIFLALDDVATAKLRVEYRIRLNGHAVTEEEIETRFKGSLKKVNLHFKKFDSFTLINASDKNPTPTYRLESGKLVFKEATIPDFVKTLFRSIHNYISKLTV